MSGSKWPRRAARASIAVAAVACVSLLSGCGDRKPGATQSAAKVNKSEITVHQINFVLQQQRNLRPEQADAAGRQILEKLIDQELAVQRADELKLDRDPRVVQQLEAAKRDVLARAYAEKVSEGAAKPTAAEISQYYAEKPALFKDRRVYSLQELIIDAKPERMPELKERLAASKSIAEFVDYLKNNNIRYAGNQAVRTAEQLPLQILPTLAGMKDGQATIQPAPAGVQVLVVAGSRSEPVSEEQARPLIEQYLLNDRKRKLVEDDLKAMRATARIEYLGSFAQGAGAAASAPAGEAAALPASGGLTPSDVSKGLGIKP